VLLRSEYELVARLESRDRFSILRPGGYTGVDEEAYVLDRLWKE